MDNRVRQRGMVKLSYVGLLKIIAAFLITLLSLYYVYVNPAYDLGTFIVGVALPLLLGSILLLAGNHRLLLFVFIAYFWSLVDDAPVNFDSVLTWPEVSRYNPVFPHYLMEVILHVLTLSFLYLVVHESLKGKVLSISEQVEVGLLTLVAFGLSYAQNIPLTVIQRIVADRWYQLDLVEHVVSSLALFLALRIAMQSSGKDS